MAKKNPVKYSYGSPNAYNRLAVKDEYTVYFIVDSSGFGTLYKGVDCLGSVDASKIYFTHDTTATLGDVTYTIAARTSVEKAIQDLYTDMLRATGNVQDDVLAYVDENYAKPADIDTAIYEFKEGYMKDTYYDKDQSDARYVAASEIDNIRALAGIFSDEEKMQQLIDAATGIDAVLSNYYDKEYIDSSVDNVLTFDSSAEFPVIGKINKIYIDDEGNTMYRWAQEFDGLPDRTYIPISGAGGGSGGGGSDVKVEAAIYIKGAKTNDSVAAGNSYTIEFAYSSANTFTSYNKEIGQFEKVVQQTGKTGSAKYFIDGVQFASGSVRQANYNDEDDSKNIYNSFVIPAARFTGSEHTIRIQITDIAGNTVSESVTLSIVSVSIRSSYTANPISLAKEIEIPVTIASTNAADVYYNIDNEGDVKATTIVTGAGSTILTISPIGAGGVTREHGVHNIKVWATTYIPESDTTLKTNVLEFDTIWYDINNNTPIIATSIDAEMEGFGYKSTQYEFVTITYQVYPASTVKLYVGDNTTGVSKLVNTLNVNTGVKNWSYTFEKEGSYTLFLEALYGDDQFVRSTEYVVRAESAGYSLDATEGSDMFFTAKDRSNYEDPAVRGVWNAEIGNYSAVLDGFAWNDNSGWHTDANTTSLRVAGGARCTIPYMPFDSDYRSTGQVIEFDFSTSNLSDSTTTVISCFSEEDNSGIVINANNAYFTSSEFSLSDSADSRIKVPFKENERIRISFVITPLNSDDAGNGRHEVSIWDANEGKYVTKDSVAEGWWRFVKVYVNGICTAVNQYSAANSFRQQHPAKIVIGSDTATIDIYSIRSYKKALYDKALVNNYVADTQDPAERMRLYLRNNILKASGIDIDYSKLLKKMPCLFITCESDVTDLTYGYANAEHILPMNKKDKRGFTAIFNCEQLDDEAREYYDFCHSFVAYNAQMTVQGTSSQYYPRKNYKLKLKPQKKIMDGGDVNSLADYNKILTTKKPTLLFWDTVGTEQGQTGHGGTPEGKLNRMNDAATFKSNYKNKYLLRDFSLSDHEYLDTASITSVPATEFCLKADFAEASSTHNTGLAKYADYILKNMGYPYLTPAQKAEYNINDMNMNKVSTRTTVDGYPIAMFWRRTYDDDYEFLGKYNFNIDKGAEDVFGFVGDIVEKETNPVTGKAFQVFDENYYDAASKEDRMKYDSPVECWEFTNNSADISKFKNVTDDTFRVPSEEYGMEWLGSFEARHPDNDNMASDYAEGKDPIHWRKFMTWVSSTDREGYHDAEKTLKIPVAWNGTYSELVTGDAATETFETYHGTLNEMNEDDHTVFDYSKGYILEPQHEVDPATHEWGPDDSYIYFGYIARYNQETGLWYEDGKYEAEDTAVNTSAWYYINLTGDPDNGKVYKYENSDWVLAGTLADDYALSTPVTYNSQVYRYDTADYRLAKFANELSEHMNIDVTAAYYVITEFFACVDQRAKNMMFASWGYESNNTKPANAYSSEEQANAAGYKGVYLYEVATVNSAATPTLYASPRTRGLVLGAAASTVCINEIYPNGKKMELYNPTNAPIDITGYTIKGIDETGAARSDWTVTSSYIGGTTLPAKGFAVLEFIKTKDGGDGTKGPTYGLSGSKAWSFTLEDNNGNVIDTVTNNLYTDGINGFPGSWGRETDGGETWVEFDAPSIGATNELVNHVCINEVFPNALSLDYPTQKGIELYNPTSSDVNLNGWTLRKGDVACDSFYFLTGELDKNGNPKSKQLNSVDDPTNSKSTTFNSDAVVPAHGYFVVVFNDGVTPNTMPGGLGPKAGFVLRLYDNNNTLVDELDNSPKVAYAEAPATGTYIEGTDVATNNTVYVVDREYMNLEGSSADHTEYRSWGRAIDGAKVWRIFDTGTPGLDNTTDMTPKYEITDLLDVTKYICRGNELSGLIYNNTRDGFIAVSDTGVIYDITLDGEVSTKTIENYDPNIRFLGVSSTTGKTWEQAIAPNGDKVFEDVTDNIPDIIPNSDLEAITKDAAGNIYIMSEYRQLNIKSTDKYPVYIDNVTGEETFDEYTNGVANDPAMSKGSQKTKKKDLDTADVYAYIYKLNGNRLEIVTKLDVNESMEGFCYYKDNLFFVGKQVTGKIYLADLTGATPNDTIALTEFADLTQYIAEVADVAYDGENVWALDSEEKSITKVNIAATGIAGTFAGKFMLTISESNPEGLLVDKSQNIFWICCDDDITDPEVMVNSYHNLFKIGMDNSNYVPEEADPGEIITSHVVLNEFDGGAKQIELYNPTDSPVNLGGLWLVKTPQDPGFNDEITVTELNPTPSYDTWQFPAGTTIPAKGFYVVTCGQSSENDGPAFGLSFKNESKKFDMYLMTDATSLRNAIGAQTIDMSKVVDHADNYTNPVVFENGTKTWGRIKDGASNFGIFDAPGTMGASNNSADSTPSGDSTETTTVKTVLYWVPIDCEYIYYPIFYDNDTILSLNNTGYIKYEPNVESTDKVGTGYAYNGTESVLWLNFKDAFATKISDVYATMRSKGGLDYASCMHYFNETQSDLWPEVLYNLDAKFKYIDPATVGYIDFSQRDNLGTAGVTVQEGGYLYECQGSRAEHRKWWLNNRFIYMDSRYNTGSTYHDAYATMRLYTPTTYNPIVEPNPDFTITPYTDMYLRVRFGSIDAYCRAEKNKPYKVAPPAGSRFNNTETIIYGAPYILSFGPLADKYADSVAIGNATKITDINLGYDSPYYNENLTNLTVSATNTSLKNIDVRGCKRLTILNGLSQINSIESLKATDTAITSIDFSETGANLKTIAYPASIATVKLVNMNYINNSGISFVNYKNLSTVWIENCPNMNTWTLIERIIGTTDNVLANVRITGINWNIYTQSEFNTWKTLLNKHGIADDTTYSLDIPYLVGTVNIGAGIVVSSGYKAGIEAMFRAIGCNLTINVANTTGLTGINIVGPDVIVPNEWYTYTAAYEPDNFVLAADKGVTWNVNPGLEYRNMTPDSIEIRYNGSTTGDNYYKIYATSIKDNTLTTELSIRPTATLESIRVIDSTGNEINYDSWIEIYEGESAQFTIKLTPEDTTDDELTFTVSGGQFLRKYGANPYEYSVASRTLTITAAEVSKTESVTIKVASATLPTKNRMIALHINNIVSRIIYLQDDTNGDHRRIAGYAEVKVEGDSNTYIVRSPANNPGVITLPTNIYNPSEGCFGFKKLVVSVDATDKDIYKYNKPKDIIMEELPSTISVDDEYVVNFYEPITALITVTNSGIPISDRPLMIESTGNTLRGLTGLDAAPYNKIIIDGADGKTPEQAHNPATIKLLANTVHEITITELDEYGQKLQTGGRYSQYTGTITTGFGTDPFSYTIAISRDYLENDIEYGGTELRMTVATGVNNYTTLRLYCRTIGPIIIDWGDETEQTSGAHLTYIDEATTERVIYHTYATSEKEYNIRITPDTRVIDGVSRSSNTQNIRWFHVISEGESTMKPCFGTGTSDAQFATTWSNVDMGGLVAYQSCGGAEFSTMPRFTFASKSNSRLITVGNIYKSCKDATNADSLFENSTLEQIPTSSSIFSECTNITSFKRTFRNTNLTNLPANFFVNNVKAKDFEETFANCSMLTSINSEEDVQFLFPDEYTEIISLKNMFKDCTALISEVPGFWKTFYGCSFAHPIRSPQYSFAGCGMAKNYANVPESWGGYPTTPEYSYTSENKRLRYIRLGNNEFGTFSLSNIILKANYRYEMDIKIPVTKPYGLIPVFGSATADDINDLDTVTNVIDFNLFGSNNGINPGICTEAFTYRLGNEVHGEEYGTWSQAIGANGQPAQLFTNYHDGRTSKRVIIDICHTNDNVITVKEYGSNAGQQGTLVDWSINNEFTTNMPLRLLTTYAVNTDYVPGDKNKYYWSEEPIYFYELKIYDKSNNLIHDIVPVYGIISGTAAAMVQDLCANVNNVYVGTGPAIDTMTYYIA